MIPDEHRVRGTLLRSYHRQKSPHLTEQPSRGLEPAVGCIRRQGPLEAWQPRAHKRGCGAKRWGVGLVPSYQEKNCQLETTHAGSRYIRMTIGNVVVGLAGLLAETLADLETGQPLGNSP